MTHTRKKASTRPGPSSERRDNSSQGPNGDNMDAARPQRLLRFGRTKEIGQVISHRKDEATRVTGTGKRREKSGAVGKALRKQREKKRDRKSYPLRGRPAGSDEEGLDCHVLLTRVDHGPAEEEGSDAETTTTAAKNDGRQKLSHRSKSGKDKRGRRKGTKVTSKTKAKSNTPREEDVVCLPEPRKRRLASLNAEAVNSLLLDRGFDQHPPAKQAKRQHEEPANERGPLDANPAWSGAAGGLNSAHSNSATKAPTLLKLEPGRGSKQGKKKAKANRGDLRGCVSQASLDAPAPRRLAGLTAAALLKLTSTSATGKQRVKAVPTATATTDSKAPVPAAAPKPPQTRVKLRAKGRSQKTKGRKGVAQADEDAAAATAAAAAAACKDKADFEPKVEWGNGGCNHKLAAAGYPPRGMLGFQLKSVKEEQEEKELNPYYCCPPEGSVEYCHRLAFFLGQRAYGDPEGQPLNPALTPVKRECLAGSPALAHAHARAALTLSPHPCLCTAERCFSSYYVHIAHPAHAGAPSAALAARPLNFAPASLCPNRVGRSKLLGPRVPQHAAGLAHPACCGPVGSPCCSEACRIGGYAYRAMPPVASRGCSFSTGYTGCQHSIKTEGYSPSQGLAPSLPLSSLPLPSGPSSTQAKPHLPTLLPGRDQPPARLKLAKECPQAPAKSSAAASPVSSGRTRLTQKQAPPPAPGLVGARQKRVSRRRATNGWRPVGGPVEKEVFIAGDEETALRQCYDGVERDGEVVRVRDTVLLRSGPRKKSLPYVAKISALWEDPKTGELMMSLFWYYRPEHTQGGRDPSVHCEKEIFASRHQDENSVACIEDRCYVLPLAQYCRFCALLKRRSEGAAPGGPSGPGPGGPGGGGVVVPCCADFAPPSHRCVPSDVDPQLVYLCRHVYDFRYGRILKNLQ